MLPRAVVGARARGVLIALGFLIAVGLLWNAAELHYEACVDHAKALPPSMSSDEQIDRGRRENERVRRAVEGCSRLPW